MKIHIIIAACFLLTASCSGDKPNQVSESEEKIKISGILEDGAGHLVTIDLMGPTAFIPIDSVRCDENGKFQFTIPGKGMNYYALKYTENGYVTIIAEPGDNISLQGAVSSIYPYEIKGSKNSELVRILATYHKLILNQLQQFSHKSQELAGTNNNREKKAALSASFDSLINEFYNYSKEFIYNNPNSPAIMIALYNQYGPGFPVFDPTEDLEIYQFTDSALYSRFPENPAILALHNELITAIQQTQNLEKQKRIKKGMSAPDFVVMTNNRKKLALSELRGKYVLLQFWASWSLPSVEENQYILKAYNNFKEKNFTIIQVSLDSDKDAWINAIKEQKEGWYHICDFQRWESTVVNLYDIQRIPANFLISPNGKIIEIDFFGEQLNNTLKNYL